MSRSISLVVNVDVYWWELVVMMFVLVVAEVLKVVVVVAMVVVFGFEQKICHISSSDCVC